MCLVPNHCPPSSFHLPLLTGLCLTSHDHVGHHLALLVLRDKLPDLLLTGEVQGKYLLKWRVKVHLDVAALHGVDVAHLREGEGQGRGKGGKGREEQGKGGKGREEQGKGGKGREEQGKGGKGREGQGKGGKGREGQGKGGKGREGQGRGSD